MRNLHDSALWHHLPHQIVNMSRTERAETRRRLTTLLVCCAGFLQVYLDFQHGELQAEVDSSVCAARAHDWLVLLATG